MPGNRFESWTLRNFGFSDAAELFVLLAGVAAALAFFRRYEQGEARAMTVKSLRRAGKLYAAHVMSTLGAITLFLAVAAVFENRGYLDLIGVAPIIESPLVGIVGVLSGGSQLGFFNILSMYVVLLAALPVMLWVAARDLRLLVAVSAGLYLATQVLQWQLPSYPDEFAWYFNPLAWQLLFVSGLVLGIFRLRGQVVAYHPVAFWLAVAFLLFSAIWVVFNMGGTLSHGVLPHWLDTLRKSNLAPLRFLHVMALGYVLVHSRAWTWLTAISAADPLLTGLGRNSLPVFVTGSFASMVGYITLVWLGEARLAVEVSLIALGLCAMWLSAVVSEAGVDGAWSRVRALIRMPVTTASSATIAPFLPIDDDVTTTPTGRRK